MMRACGLTSRPSSWPLRVIVVVADSPARQARLGDRAVRDVAHGPDVEAEEQVAHRGVAHDEGVHQLAPVDAELAAQPLELVVERPAEREAHLARHVAVVADAGHHVRPAEPLRVLEAHDREHRTGRQVHHLEHDGRGADVDGQPERRAERRRRCPCRRTPGSGHRPRSRQARSRPRRPPPGRAAPAGGDAGWRTRRPAPRGRRPPGRRAGRSGRGRSPPSSGARAGRCRCGSPPRTRGTCRHACTTPGPRPTAGRPRRTASGRGRAGAVRPRG